MKINRYLVALSLLITNTPLFAVDVEDEIALESQGLHALPPELLLMVTQELSKAETKEAAIKNILNFFNTHPLFASIGRDKYANAQIIKELAPKYFNNDAMQAALALNTAGAKEWLKEHLENKKNAQEARTPLFEAIHKKDTKRALTLIDAGLSVETRDKKLARTPLIAAANTNNVPLVKELIKRNANVNAKDRHGNSALHYAARLGNIEAVTALLENKADINIANASGMTPLIMALSRNQPDTATFLVDGGADVNKAIMSGVTPLMEAAFQKFPNLVILLLSHGAQVNAVDKGNHSPLMFAADKNPKKNTASATEIVQALLKAGATINITCIHGDTPLTKAVYAGDKKVVQLLLQSGAQVNPAPNTLTPLMVAAAGTLTGPDIFQAISGEYKDIAKLLISKGADINATYNDPLNPGLPMKAVHYLGIPLDSNLADLGRVLAALGPDAKENDLSTLFEAEGLLPEDLDLEFARLLIKN